MKKAVLLAAALVLVGLASCRSETQNQLRRDLQDFTGQRMYITLYSRDGAPLFQGVVDGKVTRSAVNNGETAGGYYIYWYDERGRYHQTDLPYLLTNYER